MSYANAQHIIGEHSRDPRFQMYYGLAQKNSTLSIHNARRIQEKLNKPLSEDMRLDLLAQLAAIGDRQNPTMAVAKYRDPVEAFMKNQAEQAALEQKAAAAEARFKYMMSHEGQQAALVAAAMEEQERQAAEAAAAAEATAAAKAATAGAAGVAANENAEGQTCSFWGCRRGRKGPPAAPNAAGAAAGAGGPQKPYRRSKSQGGKRTLRKRSKRSKTNRKRRH